MRKGDTIVRDPELRRLRALMMLEFRIKNAATLAEVAKEFKVSKNTVERTLSWAKRAGLVVKAEDKILNELVPLAHEAIKTALQEGDAGVALEIFKGVLPAFQKGKASHASAGGGGTANELAAYIEQLRLEAGTDGHVGVLEGEVVKALPATTASDAPEGIDGADPRIPDGIPPAPSGSEGMGDELDERTDGDSQR